MLRIILDAQVPGVSFLVTPHVNRSEICAFLHGFHARDATAGKKRDAAVPGEGGPVAELEREIGEAFWRLRGVSSIDVYCGASAEPNGAPAAIQSRSC